MGNNCNCRNNTEQINIENEPLLNQSNQQLPISQGGQQLQSLPDGLMQHFYCLFFYAEQCPFTSSNFSYPYQQNVTLNMSTYQNPNDSYNLYLTLIVNKSKDQESKLNSSSFDLKKELQQLQAEQQQQDGVSQKQSASMKIINNEKLNNFLNKSQNLRNSQLQLSQKSENRQYVSQGSEQSKTLMESQNLLLFVCSNYQNNLLNQFEECESLVEEQQQYNQFWNLNKKLEFKCRIPPKELDKEEETSIANKTRREKKLFPQQIGIESSRLNKVVNVLQLLRQLHNNASSSNPERQRSCDNITAPPSQFTKEEQTMPAAPEGDGGNNTTLLQSKSRLVPGTGQSAKQQINYSNPSLEELVTKYKFKSGQRFYILDREIIDGLVSTRFLYDSQNQERIALLTFTNKLVYKQYRQQFKELTPQIQKYCSHYLDASDTRRDIVLEGGAFSIFDYHEFKKSTKQSWSEVEIIFLLRFFLNIVIELQNDIFIYTNWKMNNFVYCGAYSHSSRQKCNPTEEEKSLLMSQSKQQQKQQQMQFNQQQQQQLQTQLTETIAPKLDEQQQLQHLAETSRLSSKEVEQPKQAQQKNRDPGFLCLKVLNPTLLSSGQAISSQISNNQQWLLKQKIYKLRLELQSMGYLIIKCMLIPFILQNKDFKFQKYHIQDYIKRLGQSKVYSRQLLSLVYTILNQSIISIDDLKEKAKFILQPETNSSPTAFPITDVLPFHINFGFCGKDIFTGNIQMTQTISSFRNHMIVCKHFDFQLRFIELLNFLLCDGNTKSVQGIVLPKHPGNNVGQGQQQQYQSQLNTQQQQTMPQVQLIKLSPQQQQKQQFTPFPQSETPSQKMISPTTEIRQNVANSSAKQPQKLSPSPQQQRKKTKQSTKSFQYVDEEVKEYQTFLHREAKIANINVSEKFEFIMVAIQYLQSFEFYQAVKYYIESVWVIDAFNFLGINQVEMFLLQGQNFLLQKNYEESEKYYKMAVFNLQKLQLLSYSHLTSYALQKLSEMKKKQAKFSLALKSSCQGIYSSRRMGLFDQTQLSMMVNASEILCIQKKYIIANQFSCEAARLAAILYGKKHRQYLSQLCQLTYLNCLQKNYIQAEDELKTLIGYVGTNLEKSKEDNFFQIVMIQSCIRIANLLQKQSRCNESFQYLERCAQTFTPNNKIHIPGELLTLFYYSQAKIYFKVNQVEKAVEYFEAAVKSSHVLQKEHFFIKQKVLQSYAKMCLKISNLSKKAEELATGAVEMQKQLPIDCERQLQLLQFLGTVQIQVKSFIPATKTYESAIELVKQEQQMEESPLFSQILRNLVVAYQQSKQLTKAQSVLEYIIEINSNLQGQEYAELASDLNQLGMICYKIKHYDQAYNHMTRSIQQIIQDYSIQHISLPIAYNNLGLVLISLDKCKEAIHQFKKSIEIASKYPEYNPLEVRTYYQNLIYVLKREGVIDEEQIYSKYLNDLTAKLQTQTSINMNINNGIKSQENSGKNQNEALLQNEKQQSTGNIKISNFELVAH